MAVENTICFIQQLTIVMVDSLPPAIVFIVYSFTLLHKNLFNMLCFWTL